MESEGTLQFAITNKMPNLESAIMRALKRQKDAAAGTRKVIADLETATGSLPFDDKKAAERRR